MPSKGKYNVMLYSRREYTNNRWGAPGRGFASDYHTDMYEDRYVSTTHDRLEDARRTARRYFQEQYGDASEGRGGCWIDMDYQGPEGTFEAWAEFNEGEKMGVYLEKDGVRLTLDPSWVDRSEYSDEAEFTDGEEPPSTDEEEYTDEEGYTGSGGHTDDGSYAAEREDLDGHGWVYEETKPKMEESTRTLQTARCSTRGKAAAKGRGAGRSSQPAYPAGSLPTPTTWTAAVLDAAPSAPSRKLQTARRGSASKSAQKAGQGRKAVAKSDGKATSAVKTKAPAKAAETKKVQQKKSAKSTAGQKDQEKKPVKTTTSKKITTDGSTQTKTIITTVTTTTTTTTTKQAAGASAKGARTGAKAPKEAVTVKTVKTTVKSAAPVKKSASTAKSAAGQKAASKKVTASK